MKEYFNRLLASAFFLLLIAGCGKDNGNEVIPPAPDENDGRTEWTLVFEDNFDDSSVNTAEWSMYNGNGHVGNGLRRPEAFSVENGSLVVTAQMKDGQLVSGGMAHRRSYKYGRFEFRVRTEADPSQATSGVILTWPTNENWPVDGELDIYETGAGTARNPFYTFIHYGENNNQTRYVHETDGKEWHTMMCEWTSDIIRIYRDGIVVYTQSQAVTIPKVEHHVCIQLDAIQREMTGTVKMYVDWLKIYQQQ
jgi:beta-glucanase (GH16 family)